MMQSNFSDLDQSKALQALQAALTQTLITQGISVSMALEQGVLYILLEAAQVPAQREMISLVKHHWLEIKPLSTQSLKIYGRQFGDPFTSWIETVNLLTVNPLKTSFQSLSRNDREIIPDIDRTSFLPQSIGDREANSSPRSRVDHFIVCGLGRLGQHCVLSLKSFAQQSVEIQITAIDRQTPNSWEMDQLSSWLQEEMITGDCRQDAVLIQAGIHTCRAVLIVTQDENTNIETAIAARRLNPDVRLIVRSGKQNLNELLKQHLGNFAAFEPVELPAESFALAALGDEILGLFKIGDRQLRVCQHHIQPGDSRFENIPIHKLYKESSRLLKYSPALKNADVATRSRSMETAAIAPFTSATPAPREQLFYDWHPDTQIRSGDTLFFIEAVERRGITQLPAETPDWRNLEQQLKQLTQGNWQQLGTRIWHWINAERTRKITSFGFLIAFLLGLLGTVLLRFTVEEMTWQDAISSAVILLLGGYGDVFGGLALSTPIPWWVQVICLLITATSILFFLSVLGLLADRLLSSRFDFLQRRPPVPRSQHIVLVGLGRVGQQIAALLQEFRQPFVCLTHSREHEELLPQVPLVFSPILQGLDAVNLAQAKSLIVATDDQMLNLEVALTARNAASRIDRQLNLVIRAQDQRFCDHLTGLMPDAKALCVYALTAAAFAGAAFGENILHLFQLANQTILVTEYHVEAADTLEGKLLAQIAYGYGVVPIAYQAAHEATPKVLPSDHLRVQAGDRLIVLATLNGLQRIEWGAIAPPRRWQLQALKPLDAKVTFYAGNTLENISGCPLSAARAFMDQLPQTLEIPNVMELDLYDYQADQLLRKLRRLLPVRLTLQ